MQTNQQLLETFSAGWAVYELSGSYKQDTYSSGDQRYIQQSMLVVRSVE